MEGDVGDSAGTAGRPHRLQNLGMPTGIFENAVPRECDGSGGQRPDVEIVHIVQALDLAQLSQELLGVDMAGHRLEENVGGLTHEASGADQNEQGDLERCDRIRRLPSGERHHEPGDHRADGAEQVTQHVQVGAAGVQAPVVMPMKQAEPHRIHQ